MMADICDLADIEKVLVHFYDAAIKDDTIGFFFTEVVPLDMQQHIPVIAQFWHSVLFGSSGYRNDVMAMHRVIHNKAAIEKRHLDRWVQLFTGTIDAHFAGDNAERMKQRGRSIATVMDIKLNHGGIGTKP
jgi:hemoglobin